MKNFRKVTGGEWVCKVLWYRSVVFVQNLDNYYEIAYKA